jgi:ADP-heptose:LPS heptosyltransferase
MTYLDRIMRGSKVAVVRLRSLGDCVLTTPALELLKRARPDLKIGVVVEDRFAAVFEDNPAVAAILRPSLAEILNWRPALCLNFHGGTRSMFLTAASLAPYRAGFAHHRGAWAYNMKIPRAQEIFHEERTVHTAEHLASAMFYLGVPREEVPAAFLVADRRAADHPYAVIHPVATAAYKTWRPQGFLEVAEYLDRTAGIEPVFLGSSEDDLSAFSRYRIVAGKPLSEAKSLLAGAALFVGNDSGPAHIAAALRIPLVVLFGRLDHQVIWAPWKAPASRTLASPGGIGGIQSKDVIAAVQQLKPSLPLNGQSI